MRESKLVVEEGCNEGGKLSAWLPGWSGVAPYGGGRTAVDFTQDSPPVVVPSRRGRAFQSVVEDLQVAVRLAVMTGMGEDGPERWLSDGPGRG